MGRRRNTRRLEDRLHKEREPKPLQKFYTIVHQQSIQQSDPKQNIYSPRPNATQRTPDSGCFTLRLLEPEWKTPCYVNFIALKRLSIAYTESRSGVYYDITEFPAR